MEEFCSMMSGWAGTAQQSDSLTLKSTLFLCYSMPFIWGGKKKEKRTEVNLTLVVGV